MALGDDQDVEAPELTGTDTFVNRRGGFLTWENVSLTIQIKTRLVEMEKKLLDNVSGTVCPGEVLFVMGPSGSGKTTLLEVLIDRVHGEVEGLLLLDGHKITQKMLKPRAKYVEASAKMYTSLTTRETLDFAARFYCDSAVEREQRVEETLRVLGLADIADLRIGGVFRRGLSGGEQKRISVGRELVALPEILLLDEPTSGLDTASSHGLVKYLRKITKEVGITLICTIHQPSTEMFLMSDRLMLISHGRTAYFGPTTGVEAYFSGLGFPCPKLTSIAEHVIHLINSDFGDRKSVSRLLDQWQTSPQSEVLAKEIEANKDLETSVFSGLELSGCCGGSPRVGFFSQLQALVRRSVLNTFRNPLVIWLRVAMYVILALMIGTAWLRIERTVCNSLDLAGSLFFIAAFMVFMSVSVLPAYIEDRQIMEHERANGAYGVVAYNIAHAVVSNIMILALAIITGSICYWLIGFNPEPGRFFFFLFNLFLSFAVAESMMLLVSSMIPVVILAIAFGAFIFGGFMVVEGYFVRLDNIGWWWKWLNFITLHSYSFSSFLNNEFTGTQLQACSSDLITTGPVSGESIINFYGYSGDNIWVNSAVLICMAVAYRGLALLWQWALVRAKR